MEEAEYWETVKSDIRALDAVEHVRLVGGDEDFIAGQRNVASVEYRLDLTDGTVTAIEEERAADPDAISDTLTGLRNTLELNMGLSPTEYEEGSLYVTATYDRRPGGSF